MVGSNRSNPKHQAIDKNRLPLVKPVSDSLRLIRQSLFTVRGILFLIVVSFSSFYLLEAQSHLPWQIPFGIQLFNACFFFILLSLFLSITRNSIAASILISLVSFAIGYANQAVLLFRDNPIFPWDLLSVRTAISVSDNYVWPQPKNIWLTILLLILSLTLAWLTRIRIPKGAPRRMLAAISILLVLVYGSLLQSHVFTGFFNFNETLFTQKNLYRQNGFIPGFLINLRYIRVDEPEDYGLNQVENLSEQIDEEIVSEELENLAPQSEKPNILVVMNEAFSDLSVISPFETNLETMPFFRSLTENTIRGNLYVSVVGGNTATTEFEFLTGDSMAFLPHGSVAYQQFIQTRHPGLPETLKAEGYRTIAMHPYGEAGWNRNKVYPLMGFEEMVFIDDFEYRSYIRQYISDRSVYQQMIERFEEKQPDDRLFCFAVTMQNHGGYDAIHDNFQPTVAIENENDRLDFTPTEHYLSLIRESDQAFSSLIQYFSNIDEKTIILFFGDHQPHDYAIEPLLEENGFGYSKEEMAQNRTIVPFCIWANYPIKAQQDVQISPNFLSSLLLETAGMPQSPYGYFLSEVYETIPVMTANFYVDADGRHLYDEAPEYHQALFHQYEMLQYNHLIDINQRLNSLFQPVYQRN